MNQEVRYHKRIIRMLRRIAMLMNLTVQGADLHMSLALVLEQLQSQRGLVRVLEECIYLLGVQILQTLLEAGRTLVKHAQLLVAQGCVVHDE